MRFEQRERHIVDPKTDFGAGLGFSLASGEDVVDSIIGGEVENVLVAGILAASPIGDDLDRVAASLAELDEAAPEIRVGSYRAVMA